MNEKYLLTEKISSTYAVSGALHYDSLQAVRLISMKNVDSQGNKTGLREIASLANVSISTASRVLNGSTRVDPALRKIVMDAAAKLNVNFSQRNKTKTLAFLLSNRAMLHAFHSRVLHGAEICCAQHGWDMLYLSFNYSSSAPSGELHLPKVIQRRDIVRAVILAGTNSTNILTLLNQKNIPYVVLGNNVLGDTSDIKNDVIFSDETQGGHDITRYLLGLGHTHIGFVGNIRLPWFARCFAGYCRAMEGAGLTPVHSSIDSEDDTESGYLGAKSLLGQSEQGLTAIFAGNDQTAHGVYKAIRDSGLRIPEDISVAGCDDTVGSWLYPGLTTIREFPEQLGKKMVEMILDRIAKPDQPAQRVTIPTELIKRDSCRSMF